MGYERITLKRHQRCVTQTVTVRPTGARILVVDDSALMRRSLRSLLESQDHWKVCDEAANGQEAVAKYGSERETVTPPDGMGVFDFEESGYTRQDERG